MQIVPIWLLNLQKHIHLVRLSFEGCLWKLFSRQKGFSSSSWTIFLAPPWLGSNEYICLSNKEHDLVCPSFLSPRIQGPGPPGWQPLSSYTFTHMWPKRFSLYILQNSSIKDSVPGEKRGLGGGKKCWGNVIENLMYNRGAGFKRKPTTLGTTPQIALLKSYLFYPSIFRYCITNNISNYKKAICAAT